MGVLELSDKGLEFVLDLDETFVAEMERVRGLLRVDDTEEAVTAALGTPDERLTSSATGSTSYKRCEL